MRNVGSGARRIAVAATAAAITLSTLGGAGTMAVAFFWSRWFPELRTARRLDGRG